MASEHEIVKHGHEVVEHAGLMADTHTWILFSAVIFAVIAWKKGKKPLLDFLDNRSAKISSELEEAKRLKSEAEVLLKEYEAKQNSAKDEAEKIIKDADKYASSIKEKAEKDFDEHSKRREALLLERIARAESAAIDELRHKAADIAAQAAEKMLKESMTSNSTKLIDNAIDELPKRFG